MSILDMMGMAPKHSESKNADGSWVITVTPPKSLFPNAQPKCVYLTANEYKAYREWRAKGGLIQYLLPTLSVSQREMLMTGLGDSEFEAATKSDEPCPDCQGTGGLFASHGGQVLDQPCATCGGTGRMP